MEIEAAKAHLEEAISLLAIDVERVALDGAPLGGHQDCLAMELDRIESAIGGKGSTLIGAMAASVRAAFVELLAAKAALESQ